MLAPIAFLGFSGGFPSMATSASEHHIGTVKRCAAVLPLDDMIKIDDDANSRFRRIVFFILASFPAFGCNLSAGRFPFRRTVLLISPYSAGIA
jgi:hypothetical protein